MANRDFDTALWLHNKLGTSSDQWSGRTIVSQLSKEKLRSIRDCFIDLQPEVKLKLLLSVIHISRRNVDEWRHELEDIIEIAIADDSDRWVSTIAELLKNFPNDFQINLDIEHNTSVSTDIVAELKKFLNDIETDCNMLPLECLFLNKNVMTQMFGIQPLPEKHFTLIRKPKSAAIRAELMQRASDAAEMMMSGKAITTAPSIPMRKSGIRDSLPLRGLSAKASFSPVIKPNPKSSLGKAQPKSRDGGVKLLEIDQQPSTSKKRKKSATQEDPVSDANSESPTKSAGQTPTQSSFSPNVKDEGFV